MARKRLIAMTHVRDDRHSMKRNQVGLVAIVLALLAPLAVLGGQALAAGDDRSEVVPMPSFDEFVAQCESKLASGGQLELGRVSSEEEAKGLPTTPVDAAGRLLEGALFDAYQDPKLAGSDTVVLPGGDDKQTATRYAVTDAEGHLIGQITVEDLGFGVYGPTLVDRCSL